MHFKHIENLKKKKWGGVRSARRIGQTPDDGI